MFCIWIIAVGSHPDQVIQKDVQEIQISQQQFLDYVAQTRQMQQQGQMDPAVAESFQVASVEQVMRCVARTRTHTLARAREHACFWMCFLTQLQI